VSSAIWIAFEDDGGAMSVISIACQWEKSMCSDELDAISRTCNSHAIAEIYRIPYHGSICNRY